MKGYTVDLLIENFEKIGIQNAYVDWGGEIKAKGLVLKFLFINNSILRVAHGEWALKLLLRWLCWYRTGRTSVTMNSLEKKWLKS